MLKRRTGLYLITLLVITGLAGTHTDNSISATERKFATVLMKDSYNNAVMVTKGLTEAQLSYKAAPDTWSVKDCMIHMAEAEKLFGSLFERSMKAPANPEKRAEIKLTDEQIVKMTEDRSFNEQASETIQPKYMGLKDLEDALAVFKLNRMAHIKYMKSTTEDLRNHVVQLRVGWVDCYQLYVLIAANSNRHIQQMTQIQANRGFPK